jgi:hypothetical protein
MAGLYPLSRYQQFDENAELLVGARLFLFDGGTTTPRTGYRDIALSSAHPNPIPADAAGRLPLIYLADGTYRQRLTTASGVVVFDDDGIPVLSVTGGGGGGGGTVDPDGVMKTRDIKIRFGNADVIDGYVRLNGQGIGSDASGASERHGETVRALYEELWALPGTTMVDGGPKGSSVTVDWGSSNRALKLPDCAGRGLFGMDNLGAGTRGILTSATIPAPTQAGSIGGSQQVTIAKVNLPSYNLTGGTSGSFTVSGTSQNDSPNHEHGIDFMSQLADRSLDHTHNYDKASSGGNQKSAGAGTAPFDTSTSTASGGVNSPGIDHQHRIFGTSLGVSVNHTHTFTWTGTAPGITIALGGSGTPTTNLPPAMLFMIYMRI